MKMVLWEYGKPTLCPTCQQQISQLSNAHHVPSNGTFAYDEVLHETLDSAQEHITGQFGLCRNCKEVYFLYNISDDRTCNHCKHFKRSMNTTHRNLYGDSMDTCLMCLKPVKGSNSHCKFIDDDLPEIPKHAHCMFCEHRKYDRFGLPSNGCDILNSSPCQVELSKDGESIVAIHDYFEENIEDTSQYHSKTPIQPCRMFKADYWKYLKYRNYIKTHNAGELFDNSVHVAEFDERQKNSRCEFEYSTNFRLRQQDNPTVVDNYKVSLTVRAYEHSQGPCVEICFHNTDKCAVLFYGSYSETSKDVLRKYFGIIDGKIDHTTIEVDKKIKEFIGIDNTRELLQKYGSVVSTTLPYIAEVNLKDFIYHGGPLQGDKASGKLYFVFTEDDKPSSKCFIYLDNECQKEIGTFDMNISDEPYMICDNINGTTTLSNDRAYKGKYHIKQAIQNHEDEFRSIPGNSISSY